jgi:DNA-binding transcriptional LysR family regulator
MAAPSALDPKRLIDLLRIAEHGSYTRAAAALGVSQPALSNSIAALEKALGVRLLDRTRHGASLTEYGQLLASHAEALQSALARASGDIELKKRGMSGSLIVGVSPIACVDIVPDAIARLKAEMPNISVRIHELPDDQLLAHLRSGEIDVMISPTGLLTDPPEIEREVLLHDGFIVVMRPQNPFARRKSLTLAELRDAQWVMPNAHTTMWRQIEALFAAENEPWPMNCISTNSVTALKSLVMRTDSVSISSARLVKLECDAGYMKSVPLRKPHFAREICLRRRRGASLTPPAERFIALVRMVER